MCDSGVAQIGETPQNWKLDPMKYIVKTRKGIAFKANDFCTDGIRVVKASDIKDKTIKASSIFLPEKFSIIYPKAVLKSGEIILSTVGSTPDAKESAVGQIGIVPSELDGTILNQNTVVFSLRNTGIDRMFFSYFLESQAYRKHLDLHAHGSANQASLNVSDMLNFPFPYPSFEEQLKISYFLSEILKASENMIAKTFKQIEVMLELKNALIANSVTGKIKV
jgi:type I restriction enzyme S subunit